MINIKHIVFRILIGSPKTIIPNITVPIVPIPVQIAYAVPRGKVLRDKFRKYTLSIAAIIVMQEGMSFEKFSEYFRPEAQTTSNTPANKRYIQACCIIFLLFLFFVLVILYSEVVNNLFESLLPFVQ